MLSVRPKINELTFRVYSRSIHPELLETHASRTIERDFYTLKMGITTAGHFLHFKGLGKVIFEVATSSHHELPASEMINRTIKSNFSEKVSLPEDFVLPTDPSIETLSESDSKSTNSQQSRGIDYSSEIKLEPIGATQLFSFNQVIKQCDPANALIHQFESNGRIDMGAMSYLNIESRIHSVRIQAVHTFPDTNSLLTTESVFRVSTENSSQ